MRKWHRWLSVFFGVFLLWIGITGVLSQVVPIVQEGGIRSGPPPGGRPGEGPPGAGPIPGAPAGFVCPETMMCVPKPKGDRSIVGLLHHLHSGESFGAAGTVIFTLAGFAMVFFAFSGLWLYLQMWRFRKDRGLRPKWLWP